MIFIFKIICLFQMSEGALDVYLLDIRVKIQINFELWAMFTI